MSWIALSGRCRDCGERISPRYVLVEAAVAAGFLVVLVGEYFLPPGALGFATRRLLTPYDGAAFWGMYGLHLILLTTIFGAVLIAGDGINVPPRLYGPALLAGLAIPLVWPDVRSVPAVSAWQGGWWSGLVDGAAGLVGGGLIGVAWGTIVWSAVARRGHYYPRLRYGLMGAAIGLVFGWQRALWLGPMTMLISLGTVAAIRAVRAGSVQIASSRGIAPPPPAAASDLLDREAVSEEVPIVNPPGEPTESS